MSQGGGGSKAKLAGEGRWAVIHSIQLQPLFMATLPSILLPFGDQLASNA